MFSPVDFHCWCRCPLTRAINLSICRCRQKMFVKNHGGSRFVFCFNFGNLKRLAAVFVAVVVMMTSQCTPACFKNWNLFTPSSHCLAKLQLHQTVRLPGPNYHLPVIFYPDQLRGHSKGRRVAMSKNDSAGSLELNGTPQ